MPIGASGAEAKIDDEQFPSLGGRAAARSEQSWGGGSRGTKPWDSTGRSGQTAWRAKVAAPRVRTQRFGTEKSDEPAPRGHQTVPDPPHGYSDYHRASNRSHSGRNERVCCHFLEQGHCSHGKNCRFNHSRDVDPAWTLCGFGNGCKFNHGRKLASYREEGKERDAARGCQNARACCRFLEGNCPNGARCKYRHDEGCDKSSTLCGYGVHCEFGHGTSITEATDTDGYDNPLVCCNWLQFGRCINGPACNYRHERAFDPKRTRCGFGKLCKFGHGLDMTYEQWESPYRAFQEGHWSRDGTNAAHSAKEPDRNAVKHSTISAAPKAGEREKEESYRSLVQALSFETLGRLGRLSAWKLRTLAVACTKAYNNSNGFSPARVYGQWRLELERILLYEISDIVLLSLGHSSGVHYLRRRAGIGPSSGRGNAGVLAE